MGANDFDAEIPSSAIYPSPEIYYIGTPSDRATSEGFRSALSHGTSSVPSYSTSSPVSFGPSTPVQSASAAPAGLQSSPGGMSDVGSTLTPPGLPLRHRAAQSKQNLNWFSSKANTVTVYSLQKQTKQRRSALLIPSSRRSTSTGSNFHKKHSLTNSHPTIHLSNFY